MRIKTPNGGCFVDLTANLIPVLAHWADIYLFSHFQLVILNMLCLPMLALNLSFMVHGRVQGWVCDSGTSGIRVTENEFHFWKMPISFSEAALEEMNLLSSPNQQKILKWSKTFFSYFF